MLGFRNVVFPLMGVVLFSSCFADGGVSSNGQCAGLFVSAGVGYGNGQADWHLDDNLGTIYSVHPVFNLGIGPNGIPLIVVPEEICDLHDHHFGKSSRGSLIGSVCVGYNGFTEDYYFAAFSTLDISRGKSSERTNKITSQMDLGKTKTKTPGVTITLGARLGKKFKSLNGSIVYISFGLCNFRGSIENDTLGVKVKSRRISPVVGVGFEKNISDNLSCNIELSTLLYRKKVVEFHDLDHQAGRLTKVENEEKWLKLKMGLVYYIHID